MLFLGYPLQSIASRIRTLTPVAMRLEMKQGRNQCTLINDSYNSDIGSLSIALNTLARQNQHPIRTLILSDILQSGKAQDSLYEEIARLIAGKNIDRLIGIGPDISAQANRFSCAGKFYPDTASMLADRTLSFHNEAILIKGSRPFAFEQIVQVLEAKAHQTVLEINLNALTDNYNYFKAQLRPETRITAMVKALSYGSGSFEIASVLQYQKVDYLAVAIADEGKELRDNGITVPVMVMNPEAHSFRTLLEYQLEPELYSISTLSAFQLAAEQAGVTDYPVHLKLDTGMHRLGFTEEDLPEAVHILRTGKCLKVCSVFSHLAGSDSDHLDDFTRSQIALFEEMSQFLREQIGYEFLRHILNSAGIERFPQAQFDMVRLGIGLHGISALPDKKLRPVATLKTVILQIKHIPPGASVGYSRRFIATRPTRIGIMPIGYADGLRRALGNGKGSVSLSGQRVPIIGNVCMDSCMIDLTDVEAREGDEVIVFGEDPSVTEVAGMLGTIPYEILTGISPRVKRVYYQE
jgi:alanine racemase